jgi:peptide/nickel transport system substrate-binding protein
MDSGIHISRFSREPENRPNHKPTRGTEDMRRLAKLSGLLLAGTLLAFPVFAADLRIGLMDDADVLDPAQSRTFVGRIVYTSLCDKLVDLSPELTIVPQLATKWEWNADGSALTMDLREGVVFHDGTPFNAEAAVYNIERGMTLPESRRKSELASVAKIEATGEHQIKFTLKSPDASLLAQLSDRAGMMISQKAGKELGANFGSKPVCSGPFKFVERIQQDRIVLEKFAGYWNAENIFIDKVTYLPIPDTTVRLANLRSGELDILERLGPSDAASVQADNSLNYGSVIGPGYIAMYTNIANGPRADNPFGKDKRLRQAFSLAIDRQAINQVVFEGTAMAGNQPFPPTSPWFNTELPVPERDVEKAKALMKEAGYEKFEIELQHANNTTQTQMMQVIQSMVAEAGFDVKLKATEFATLLSEQTAGNYVLSRSDWSGRADPDGNIHQFITCKGGINDTKYCNPEVDTLLNEARASTDNAVRKAKYDAASVILNEDMPIIYLGHQPYLYAFDKDITGFTPSPDGMIRLVGVKKGS